MHGQWTEVARVRFRGERFRDHALDLSALAELLHFQEIVSETAKALWRAANPGRERLPERFDERTRLSFRRIEDGSATVPLEVYLEPPEQRELFEPEPVEVQQAIALAYDVLESAGVGGEIPNSLPRRLIPQYAQWGRTLGEADEIELLPADRTRPVAVNRSVRERLESYAETPQTTVVEVTGECLEADVRQRRFQIWLDPQTPVQATFDAAQEDLVTSALKDHHAVRIRVSGTADLSPQGKPSRFTSIESLQLVAAGTEDFDPSAPAVEEELSAIWADVPEAEWGRLPSDLTDNLDHYVYGTPE